MPEEKTQSEPQPYRVRLPGFVSDAEIGLGDDNAGAMDDHRALNYIAMRYPGVYTKTAEQFARDFALTEVETRPSPLSGSRKMTDVVLSYTNRNTDFTEKLFVRVDVTEEFPFLVTKLSPYYDR